MLATIIYLFIFFKAGLTKVDIPRSKKKKKKKKRKKKYELCCILIIIEFIVSFA